MSNSEPLAQETNTTTTSTHLRAAVLAILRCPSTGAKLERMDPAALMELNGRIATQKVLTFAGESVERPLADALTTCDRSRVYPVSDGIPVLTANAAIPLE